VVISYLTYGFAILWATSFGYLAQVFSRYNNGKKVPNYLFIWLSMAGLILILGFRDISVGVDGLNYYNNYFLVNSMDLITYYQNYVTEPGFYLLYRISYFLGDAQWLFIISAFITVFLFYQSLSYEMDKISLPLAVFIFATTQYFYYFGIMRMGIAVAIIAFAYRYVIEGNKKKFLLFVFLASMFHYSSLFALAFIFLSRNNQKVFKKINGIKIFFIIPVGFLLVKYIIFPLISAGRYQGYIESSGRFDTAFLTSLPLLVLFALNYNAFSKISLNYQFYFLLFIINVSTEFFAPLIGLGIGRMVWYVNLSVCFLLPAIIRVNKDKNIKLLILFITLLYCLVYSYFAYFGDSWRGQHMLPYKFFFESLN